MRLVLGLAALAVTLSGAAGAGQNGPAIARANPTKAQKMGDDAFVQDKKEVRVTDLEHELTGVKLRSVAGDAYYTLTEKTGDNDSAATAQDFGSIISNGWDFTHYSSSGSPTLKSIDIIGNIAQDHGEDWYKFTIYGKADFSIDLTNIPNQCDYDISLYKNSNGRFAATDYEITNIAGSAYGSNQDEHISKRLLPGVYYIRVFSYRGYGSPTYTLTVDGNYVREDVCIEDMMAKGANAALWYSDYDPFGIKPSIADISTHGVGQLYSRLILHTDDYDHYHPEFPHVLDQSYKQAEIFVWGKEYRNKLRNIVRNALEQAEAQYLNATNLYAATKKVGNTITIVIGALGAVASVISLGSSTAATVAGVVSLSLSLAGLAYEAVSTLFPMGVNFENYQRFIDYLGDLHAALECDAYTSDTEVVRIPIRYTIKKTKTNDPVVTQTSPSYIYDWSYTTTYTLSYAPAQRQWNYLYDDGGKQPGQRRYIHAIDHEGDTPFTGTVFPVFDSDSMNKAWNRQNYDMTASTISLNGQASLSLSSGQYKWYKFTAPRSGTFYFTSEGDSRATLDVFDRVVYGKSDYSRITREYHSINVGSGFSYSTYMYAGQVRYFRISGGCGSYTALSTTTFKVSDTSPIKLVYINANDLDIGTTWNDEIIWSDIHDPYDVYVETCGVFYNTERHSMEMRCERGGVCECAFMYLFFDRPLKSLSFGTYIGNSYTYAHLNLEVRAFDDDGSTVQVDFAESYCSDEYIPNYFNYENLNPRVYGVVLTLDPDLDQSPYHVSYQEQLIGDIVVEFQV